MKVLITTDWYTSVINGVVASVQVLSRELTKRGHEVRILTLSENRHSYINEEVFYAGSAGIGRLYPGARIKLPGTGWGMKELLHWRPDIIHSQCECSTFILAKRIAAELKIPIIHTCHTIYEDYTHYFSPREKWGREIVQRITRRISRQVSGMIVPSEKVRKILENYQVACPLWVIPSGIDLSGFETQENEKWREEIRKKYSISSKETVILYVGRLAKEKNVKELLQYQQKKKEGKEVLMLVGDGPLSAGTGRVCEGTLSGKQSGFYGNDLS
jgi:1,2-diacylglycerol 3-alpha-glucosyltransferase